MAAEFPVLERMWNHEHGTSARLIRALPAGQEGFRPHPRSRSAGEIAWHLAEAERWFVAGGLGLAIPGEDPVPKDSPPATAAAMADAFDRSHGTLLEAVRAAGEPWLHEVVPFFGTDLARRTILNMMIRHEVHHRGQFSVYLRLAGGTVPSIYGPTADDPGHPA